MYKLANGKEIDEDECLDALNDNGGEFFHWLDSETGEVVTIAELDDMVDVDEMSDKYDSDPRYFAIPKLETHEKYEIMVKFAEFAAHEDKDLAEKLFIALNGQGAFRRFKDAVYSAGKEWVDSWYEWEKESLFEYLDAWLKDLPIDINDGWQDFFENNCDCPICQAMARGDTDEESLRDAFREANFNQVVGDIRRKSVDNITKKKGK